MSDKVEHIDQIIETPSIELGPRASHSMINDARHIVFVLARYKFCAKMLQGKKRILEFGCGDALGTPVVAQVAEKVYAIDRESRLIESDKVRLERISNIEFHTMDMINSCPPENLRFDAAYSIDVIEHITLEDEAMAMGNLMKYLEKDAVVIIGTPNITSEKYASTPGASPHINLKSHETLRQMMEKYFTNTFIFSMNDEVIHTGYYPMAHYLWGIGVGLKDG
jgi:2-polyprenyl-3-methyl-5-hydroxy-6-metoxy-1,4-benzoquinol methylase